MGGQRDDVMLSRDITLCNELPLESNMRMEIASSASVFGPARLQ